MIVKNEMANLERCLSAVAPHISSWVIGDTGSTDGTQDFIRAFFAARNIPGEIHEFPFHNFEQARNAALRCAYESTLKFDYLLLDDADMELVVEDSDFRTQLGAPGYQLLQRTNSGLKYWNTRLVRREIGAWYHGVTHEYLDVPGGVQKLASVWYRDHASGSNRVDKFDRDARLLREALEKDPENHRYWFYLAQSYQDGGRVEQAIEAYAKRANMGGWDEEAWAAHVRLARNLLNSGDEPGFVSTALAAFDQRPTRAEPLYDLARHFRNKGLNHASTLFSERGLTMKPPESDILFIEDWIYQYGLRQEFSISANYARDPSRKALGFAACNYLALDREVPNQVQSLALSNLDFYVRPALEMMPSFRTREVGFAAPEGYYSTNPSVFRVGGDLMLVQRTVNYSIDLSVPHSDPTRYSTSDGAPIHTRNFLLQLNDDLSIRSSGEILPPSDMPAPLWPSVQGFEDMRPFHWRGAVWCLATTRELSPEGMCQQVLVRIDERENADYRISDWRVLGPEGEQAHEKNWMPAVIGDHLRIVHSSDPTRILDEKAQVISETIPPIRADSFRGGSQLVPFDGGWLTLIHEMSIRDDQRKYKHRFVWFDADLTLCRLSLPFYFCNYSIEFAAGMAWANDGQHLLISYGANDNQAWIASVLAVDVRSILNAAADGPDGSAGLAAEKFVPNSELGELGQNSLKDEHALITDRAAQKIMSDRVENSPSQAVVEQNDLNTWLQFCERYHRQADWDRLRWSCFSALEISATSSFKVEESLWRLHDLMALACSHLGMAEQAVRHGSQALTMKPDDSRLISNLAFYRQQLNDIGRAWLRLFRTERVASRNDTAVEHQFTNNAWEPGRPLAGTELMIEGLRKRLGHELDKIDLEINMFNPTITRVKPLVLWMHHDIDQEAVQWCKDASLVEQVSAFVFVSNWQKDRYIQNFQIPWAKCIVLRNATSASQSRRMWRPSDTLQFAYTSTPFRGLAVLLDAWDELDLANAQLHVWSSMKLYGETDSRYESLIERAKDTPGVIYNGISPREQLLDHLRNIDFLIYPCTFAETSCLAAIDAMSVGCRVIAPAYGALPETTAGFARLYPWSSSPQEHTEICVAAVKSELARPWGGASNLSLDQQNYVEIMHGWEQIVENWKDFIGEITKNNDVV